ncbi:MAG: hypothetical protein KOO62_01805 [candidate division Zixibacteria bacterium]|nr:hypothetical protein [candidate division Zixibacteria bacterium]
MKTMFKAACLLFAGGMLLVPLADPCAGEEASIGDTGNAGASQHLLDGWALGAAYSLVSGEGEESAENGLKGPSFHLVRANPNGIGIEFGGTYLVPSGFYSWTGLSLDIALNFHLRKGSSTIVLLKLGTVGFIGGNSDGGGGGDGALFPGLGMMYRLTNSLILSADVSMRFWLGYEGWTSPGARASLLLRL